MPEAVELRDVKDRFGKNVHLRRFGFNDVEQRWRLGRRIRNDVVGRRERRDVADALEKVDFWSRGRGEFNRNRESNQNLVEQLGAFRVERLDDEREIVFSGRREFFPA